LAVYPDDTFIVSYPRSGNTWTRFLIANLLHPEELVTFASIERLIPDAEAQSSRSLKKVARPRFIKSHEYFDHRYPRVVYIVRDPRDVVLSYYHFQRKYRQIDDQYPLERYVGDFVNGRPTPPDWGTWGENVGTWLSARANDQGFLLLRYEDIMENPTRELGRIAGFLGVDASPQRLESAITRSSVERMRELEQKQTDQWVSTKNRRKDIPFIRTAFIGEWKSALSTDSVVEIESAWGAMMLFLNYQLATAEGQRACRDRSSWWAWRGMEDGRTLSPF
jgi:hypothetical protein